MTRAELAAAAASWGEACCCPDLADLLAAVAVELRRPTQRRERPAKARKVSQTNAAFRAKAEASGRALALQQRAAPILAAVAVRHQTLPSAIFSTRRDARAVAARFEVYRELRALGWSLPDIGLATGRDHTTVHAALARMAAKGHV